MPVRGTLANEAVNMMSVLRAEQLLQPNRRVDVITHSYGSLIFEEMYKIAARHGKRVFDDSEVIMLAPAGLNGKEHAASLGYRFLRMLHAETKIHKDFDDERGEMFAAAQGHTVANVPRAVFEGLELARRRLNLSYLLNSSIGRLTVMNYAEDTLFPDRLAQKRLASYLDATDMSAPDMKLQWAIPISTQQVPAAAGSDKVSIGYGKELRLGADANHNDEQFNPSRVAGAVSQVLNLGYDRRSSAL